MKSELAPFEGQIKAKGHSAQYRMHKYYARRPYNVFSALVEHYSKPGDIILDVFCGGGVTLFESLALDRKTIGVDLNPLASFITEMQLKQVDTKELAEFLYNFITELEVKYGSFYDVEDGTLEWIEWAYDVKCPSCQSIISLSEENKVKNGFYRCHNKECIHSQDANGARRVDCEPYSSTPIRLKINCILMKQILQNTC